MAIVLVVVCGCGVKEQIRPKYEARTINEQRAGKPLNFSLAIDPVAVDEFGDRTGRLPLLGPIFQNIARMFANISIASDGDLEIKVEPTTFELESLIGVNPELIEDVVLDRVQLDVRNARDDDDFDFLKKIEIYMQTESLESMTSQKMLILSYYRGAGGVDCRGKCIVLKINDIDWKELVLKNKSVTLIPVVSIDKVPKRSVQLAGRVNFSLKLDLGF